MKHINILVLIFIFFLPGIFLSQETESYLVAINVENQNKLQLLEEAKVNYYYQQNEKYISSLNLIQLDFLSENDIDFIILDKNPQYKNYYLLTPRRGKTLSGVPGQLYKISNDISLIVHSDEVLPLDLSREFNTAPVSKIPESIENTIFVNRFSTQADIDTLITGIVNDINPDSVRYYIQSLQDFDTRFLFASNRGLVADWIKSEFEKMGFTEVEIDSFVYNNTWQKNVIATLPGEQPDIITVVGGHHDSYSSGNPRTFAPGADDNASGTSAVLEIARVLKKNQVIPNVTIKFVTFAAEEYGLHGSDNYAQKLFEAGSTIKLMINHDMISHTSRLIDQSNVDINYYSGSEDFTEIARNSTNQYSRLKAQTGTSNSAGSDSYSFWSYGFPAVYFEERDFSPYYHSPSDVIENYNMEYCAEVIKASCATLLIAIQTPMRVDNFVIQDVGDGESLYLTWDPNLETDVMGYKIHLGNSSGVYDNEYTTTSNSYLITGLSEGDEYFIGISVYNARGYESMITQKYFTPLSIPLSPIGLIDAPQKNFVELSWSKNLERDLLGYNIYRSESENGEMMKINSTTVYENNFVDEEIKNAQYYFYSVTAVDSAKNESSISYMIRSMGISLDRGILLVDETLDGDGSLAYPTDDEVDNFYKDLLQDIEYDQIDTENIKDLKLADLGSYSIIIWHNNDFNSIKKIPDVDVHLSKYLEFGGNLIYTGFMPSRIFMGNTEYPLELNSGDFLFDYFKIKTIYKNFGSRFGGAIPVSENYFPLSIDSSKTDPDKLYHLGSIEGFEAAADGNIIYNYNSHFDSSTPQGSMSDLAVGLEYLGSDYKSVILSFPLYFMNPEEAKNLLTYIVNDRFNGISSAGPTNVIPQKFHLYQNYPNPFNPSTTIRYEIPNNSVRTSVDPKIIHSDRVETGQHMSLQPVHVKLCVYDILGNEITTLVNKQQSPGNYEVEFNAAGLSSGVYFYKLTAGVFVETKKMVLLR